MVQVFVSGSSTGLGLVVGDIATVHGAIEVAEQVNAAGRCDAVIHNAGIGSGEGPRLTADGVPDIFGVNVLAPYILTALIESASRLIYSVPVCTAQRQVWMIFCGAVARGTDRPPIPRASSMLPRLHSRSPVFGRKSGPTPWTRAGCRREWGAKARPTISTKG